jgi:23S rRNA (cytosine1962-C5)-methyltransferase
MENVHLGGAVLADVYLEKSRKKRLEAGHPWVYRNEIARIEGEPEPGGIVRVLSASGQFLASGYYNAKSQIAVRIVGFDAVAEMDRAFFADRFRRCLEHRERFLPGVKSCRLVYGEADFLPGLVVDRFDDVLVVQILSLGMERRREQIVDALVEVFAPAGIYERSDVAVRELEGLEPRKGLLWGDCPRHVEIEENGLRLIVDIHEGQ